MGNIASQITSHAIVDSAVYSGAHQRKYQCSASLAFVRGIQRGPVNSPHKWPLTRKMFPLMTSSCIRWSMWLTEMIYLMCERYEVELQEMTFIITIHDDVIKWKHFPRYWPFVPGIHRSPVNSPHKGQWRGALMFSLICTWINIGVNNREAVDLRRHRAHYDVIVMQNAR